MSQLMPRRDDARCHGQVAVREKDPPIKAPFFSQHVERFAHSQTRQCRLPVFPRLSRRGVGVQAVVALAPQAVVR